MQRLAELDAKNPNKVKETKDSNQKDKKGAEEGIDPNYQYSDDYSEWKKHHDIDKSRRISNPPTPTSSKYPANSREDLEDRLASAKERLAMLNPNWPADRSSFADYKYVIANLERALANMNEESVQDDLTLESIRMISGIKKTLAECGIEQMSMTGAPGHSTPASISITAANGPELSGMLRDIMQLAGRPHSEEEPLITEPVATVEPAVQAEPADAMQVSPTDSMRSVIDILNPDDGEDNGEDDEEEVKEYDNSPSPKTTGYASMTPTGSDMHSKGGEAPKVNGGGNPMQRTMEQIEKDLLADYYKFINE